MAKNILVATPQPAFGELLRLSLEESGRYRVRLVSSGREALASADHIVFSLAILDASLDSPPMAYVMEGLRKALPNLRVLVIPPPEGLTQADMAGLSIDGTVSQPFYAPDLLETIDRLTYEPKDAGSIPAIPKPMGAWIQQQPGPIFMDPGLASRQLEDFLQDSTAPGVLVILSRQPWASAGELSPAATNEVAGILARYTESNEGVDLARFVHLASDGNEYLIYATPLTDGLVLALIYQINTPLTVIRNQAGRLARQLRQAPPPVFAAAAAPAAASAAQAEPARPAAAVQVRETTAEEELPEDEPDEDFDQETRRLADLLADMPSPNPPEGLEVVNSDWVQAAPPSPPETGEFLFPWEVDAARQGAGQPQGVPHTGPAQPENPPSPSPTGPQPKEEELPPAATDAAREVTGTGPSDATVAIPNRGPSLPTIPILVEQPDARSALEASLEKTQPVALRSFDQIQQTESLAPALSRLAYTCVLIPRLPGHLLIDQTAEQLSGWLPQLCLAYGWRLEGLLIRPEYMQWTVQVAPAISPGNVIRLIRQQSSRRIFGQFPQFEIDNPSGDFWAPGYLIISGFQPPSINLVHDFIQQTRMRQGSTSYTWTPGPKPASQAKPPRAGNRPT